MARTAIPVIAASDVGGAISGAPVSADGGIAPPNAALVISNGTDGPLTVTIQTPAGLNVPTGLDLSDRTLVVPAFSFGVIGPFPPQFYARQTAPDVGQVYVDFSFPAGVSAFAVQIPLRSQL